MTVLESGWQHCFVETNRIRLHCVTQGEGDLVILLHGFPEFWYSWRHQIPALARHFKVVVPDLRGYNDSDKPADGYDLDTLSNDIRGLIESLGYLKAHVVGHDWGGTIAWSLAQKFPQSISRLAVLNALHPNALHPYNLTQTMISNLDQLRRSWHILAFQIPALPEWLIQQNLRAFVKNMLQEQASRKGAFSKKDTELYQAALEKPGVLTAAINHYRHLFSPQAWTNQWGRSPKPITVPTLVLWGEDDALVGRQVINGIDKLIAAPFRFAPIAQCGHWIQQEAPQTVNRELLNFLRQ